MKNKTKKILAGIGLGVMGMSVLTGCSMSAEQQAALDKVVNKADEIIQLIDTQNKQLSKQEAYEMIVLSNNTCKMGLMSEVEIKITDKFYNGYFEEELEIGEDNNNLQIFKYQSKDNIKKINMMYYRNDVLRANVSTFVDYDKEVYHMWIDETGSGGTALDKTLTKEEANESRIGGNFLSAFIFGITDPNQIYDIKTLEDGSYEFTCLEEWTTSDRINYIKTKIKIKDNLLTKVEMWNTDNNTATSAVNSRYSLIEFSYENVDFADLDAKVAALQA